MRYTDVQQVYGKILKITNYYLMKYKSKHNEIPLHMGQNVFISKSTNRKVLERVWRKRNHSTLLVGMKIGKTTMENNMDISQKSKNRATI